MLYSRGPSRVQCYKTFYVRNLLIFVLSSSVLSLAIFSSLAKQTLWLSMKIVDHGQKKFYNIFPWTSFLLTCKEPPDFAECHYTECRHAECRGAFLNAA
jgi:hypothetical protein